MTELTPRDQIADRLRRRDHMLAGDAGDSVPLWQKLAEPEHERWHAMADEAFAAVGAYMEVVQLATSSGPR